MTAVSSAYSSQALVPVVTVRSSRASAWVRTILRSDTDGSWTGRRWVAPIVSRGLVRLRGHYGTRSGSSLFTRGVTTHESTRSGAPVAAEGIPSRRRRRPRRGRLVALVVLLLLVVGVVLAVLARP